MPGVLGSHPGPPERAHRLPPSVPSLHWRVGQLNEQLGPGGFQSLCCPLPPWPALSCSLGSGSLPVTSGPGQCLLPASALEKGARWQGQGGWGHTCLGLGRGWGCGEGRVPLHRSVFQSCTGLVAPSCVSLLPRNLQGTWEPGGKGTPQRCGDPKSTPFLALCPWLCSSHYL